jgi:hypothetical protein
MSDILTGFLNSAERTVTGGGGANSVLGFLDSQRGRQSRERMFERSADITEQQQAMDYAVAMQKLDLIGKDNESLARLRAAQGNEANSRAEGNRTETAILARTFNDEIYGQAAIGLHTRASNILRDRGVENPTLEQVAEVVDTDPTLSRMAATAAAANPNLRREVSAGTGLQENTLQLNDVDNTGNYIITGQNAETGQPGALTRRPEPAYGNPSNEMVTLRASDFLLGGLNSASAAGLPVPADFEALRSTMPQTAEQRLAVMRGEAAAPVPTSGQSGAAARLGAAGVSDAVIEAGSANPALGGTGSGFIRGQVTRRTNTDDLIRLGDAEVAQERERGVAREAFRRLAADFDDPYRETRMKNDEERARLAEQDEFAIDAIDEVVRSLTEDSIGPDGFGDKEFEEFRRSSDPAKNREALAISMSAALTNPTQLRKLIAHPKLNFPGDRSQWTRRHWETAAQIAALSARRSENRFDFGTGARDTRANGVILDEGIEDYLNNVAPQEQAGFFHPR